MFSPSSARTDSTAMRCPGVSSTIRMSTRSRAGGGAARSPAIGSSELIGLPSPWPWSANQPRSQHRDELFRIDRLRQIVPRTGFDAFLPIALHRLGGDRDDRHVPEARI